MSGSIANASSVSTNEEIIEQVVDEFLKAAKAFTAYDVTIEARKRGMQERHRNIKSFVHSTIATILDTIQSDPNESDYDRELKDVGAPEQAFLYFPDGYNTDRYEAMDRNDTTPRFTTNTTTQQIDGVVQLTKCTRNRLYIPTVVLQRLRMDVGEKLRVYQDGDKTYLVSDDAMVQNRTIDEYTVEKSCCARISMPNMDPTKDYKLEFEDDDAAFIVEVN